MERERLVSEDPYEAARCRIWADRVNRDCCSPYYGVLVQKEEHEQRMKHFEKLIVGLKAFSRELVKTSGPLFLADAQVSNVCRSFAFGFTFETCNKDAHFFAVGQGQ